MRRAALAATARLALGDVDQGVAVGGQATFAGSWAGGGPSATAIALNLAMINVSLGFTALRFTMSSGNIASGVFRIFRRAR